MKNGSQEATRPNGPKFEIVFPHLPAEFLGFDFLTSNLCYSSTVANHETYMRMALEEARRAEQAGEVPVGAVVVIGDRVAGAGGNRTIADCDPTAHAEIVALRAAAKAVGNYRLAGAALYVTIEPCAMCAGAIVQARIAQLIYGADDPKAGAVRSVFAIADHPQLNHRVEVTAGALRDECAALLQSFFATRR